MQVELVNFNSKKGLDRGKPFWVEAIWYLFKMIFFLTAFPWPNKMKVGILRVFGAKIGKGVIIKPRVNIHFPWKLTISDYVWIGEEVFILNFEQLIIESNVCVSQRAFLCGGNHDFRDPTFAYRNGKIHLKSGCWIGAQSFVGPDITINENAVITAGSIVSSDMPKNMICGGMPCQPIRPRFVDTL